ncbi:MAG: ribosome assembly RNA-binding protein YhbY [Lachnospiraceae bacterium]|nr:ribosome assembly RNA-binding protein YhbY [Lachnospiraceae bacterium]
MTSKQRAYLKGIASTYQPIIQIGKSSLTPEITIAVDEALSARELVKINVLKNCADDPKVIAEMLSERTRSAVVHVIGKKIVLFRQNSKKEDQKIKLPLD